MGAARWARKELNKSILFKDKGLLSEEGNLEIARVLLPSYSGFCSPFEII